MTYRSMMALVVFIALFVAFAGGRACAQSFATPPPDAPVEIEADSLSYDQTNDTYTAEGNVVINYGDGVLTADAVSYNRKTHQATAQGNARLKMGDDYLLGDRIEVNTQNKTGVAYHSKAFYAQNHFYISGDRIERTGENTFVIDNPVATTCDGPSPDWELAGSRMKVTIDGYGWVTNARFRAAGVPMAYTPLIAFPAKTTRQSGLLMPYLSYSKDKDGLDVEVPVFWAINPHMDATLYLRYLEKRGLKAGSEFRYWFGDKTKGVFYADYLRDQKEVTETQNGVVQRDWREPQNRWSYYWNQQTNFDSSFYVRADVRGISDRWYFRDFNSHNYYLSHFATDEQDPFKKVPFLGDESLRSLESSARLYKGGSWLSFSARVRSRDDLGALNNDQTLQKYPELVLSGSRRPVLDTPLYFEFTSVYDYFYRKEGQRGHYAHIAPSFSVPLTLGPYAKLTPKITLYQTFWHRDDDEQHAGTDVQGHRSLYNASMTLGTQISRVFDTTLLGWEKIRHEIKPEIEYSYIPHVNQEDIPNYLPKLSAAIAPIRGVSVNALDEQNAVAWSLTSTFTARTKTAAGDHRYLEFLRFKLLQTYDIQEARRDIVQADPERRPMGHISMELDFQPHRYVGFAARNHYSTYLGWTQTNYDLSLSDKRGDQITLGYRYTLNSIEEINVDLKAVITERLSVRAVLREDLFNDRSVEKTLGLTYTEQCWSIGVDYTRNWEDERVLFRLSLTGLGQFGL